MPVNEYIKEVKKRFNAGNSTEHSYRADLQALISSLVKGISVTNEPKRQKCGAPDYIIQRKEVPLGYIETKDINIDLYKEVKSDQMNRYLGSLDNLILTDYIDFHFFRYGQKVKEIKIASIDNGKIKTHPENFDSFETHIKDFCDFQGQTIKSAEKLAKMMAQKARMMEEVIFKAVLEEDEDDTLKSQLEAFRMILIHDLDERTFSDIYAQTIAYGLFAARLHDKTLDDFSRQEARELIPRSNPFLRNLFDYISGAQLDDRVVWIVNDLCEIFRATDLQSILADFGKSTGQNDPFIHFYETFLAAYDPKLRKSRGVYYTPEPVVNFIVRAVDDILKDEFGLPEGLADTSKIKIKQVARGYGVAKGKSKGKDVFEEIEVHKVQILDPAAGTGTFLSETVKQIYSKFKGQEGLWSSYVEDHLIPRLNGFEILMASYTMCHLKLEMLLKETGYEPRDEDKQKRLRVFLTNSLEEYHPDTGDLFANWLTKEATEANYVKRDTPVMVVIGNPPYANFGQMNQGDWIKNLISDYKKNLNEKKINLDDDYIKFIRYGQHFIEKNSSGILAYISNNSFIDGITHRQMRKCLIDTFNKIYILDLHGNSMRKEKTDKGENDENVFDIQQGVSINILIKSISSQKLPVKLYHYDVLGQREEKYSFLKSKSLSDISWNNLPINEPHYFFSNINIDQSNDYNSWLCINEIFNENNSGIQSGKDEIVIDDNKSVLFNRISDIKTINNVDAILNKYKLQESSGWNLKNFLQLSLHQNKIKIIQYKPFDNKYIYFDAHALKRDRYKTTRHVVDKDNISLIVMRQYSMDIDFSYSFVSKHVIPDRFFISNKGTPYFFPLYLYPDDGSFNSNRSSNINLNAIEYFEKSTSLKFTIEKSDDSNTFSPIDILDYTYSCMYSPSYRDKYKEFLKIDFPRIPFPEDKETFWKLVKLGSELRTIHLLENPNVELFNTQFQVSGNNIVEKLEYKEGKVFINGEQYFNNVPEIAWYFYIGGYQPAQKWLKDRKGRELNSDDIRHYQKIIVALTETDRIMQEIDKVVEF